MRIPKDKVKEVKVLRYNKKLFTTSTLVEAIKEAYQKCIISINDTDDKDYYIVTLSPIFSDKIGKKKSINK